MKTKILALFLLTAVLSASLSGCIVYTKQINEEKITKDQAVDIAIDYFDLNKEECKFIDVELDTGDYDVEIICNGMKYEAVVTIFGGQIHSVSKEPVRENGSLTTSDTTSDGSVISEEEAKELASLALDLDVELCTFTSIEFDDGYYEIELFYNNVEYDVKVDSVTGTVTEVERD